MDKLPQGWGWPANSKKAHYFLEGEIICLCRRWMFSGLREDRLHESPDNCKTCGKMREKLANGRES